MSKTKAELQQELETLQQQIESLQTRGTRERYGFGVWPNIARRTERDPAWRGTVRLVIPEHAKPGDALWVDFSEWEYDEATSPVKYTSNPPVFSGSISPCPAQRARELEKRREDAMRERGQLN